MGKDSVLLNPIKVGNVTLKNRIMFPPQTTGYEERDGSIGERSFNFYKRIAQGGASFVTIGDVTPVMTASPTPKLCDDRQIPTYKKLADMMHEYDCKVALQLFHPEYDVPGVGRMIMGSRKAMMDAQALKDAGDMEGFAKKMEESKQIAAEAHKKLHHDMLHFVTEASVEQLMQIKEAILQAARRAQEAGIDAIEVHGDRLLGSLCSTILNHRTDNYGGSLENRCRYALEVVKGIKEIAPKLIIEYKLPFITKNEDGSDRGKGGLHEEDGIKFAKMLEEAGVDMIQVAQANHTGNMCDTIPPMGTREYSWMLPITKRVKEVVNIPVAVVGKIVTVENGEKIIASGDADIVCYGRSLLCDPDIPKKIENDEPIRECLQCNKGCVDAISSRRYISCVINAENGDEGTIFIKPADTKKNVVIIGAGLAGLEAARVAGIRGHNVDVYEKENKIGGQVHIAAVPPRKSEILRSVEYYEKILPKMENVKIHLETEATVDIMNKSDAVIVAIGAHNLRLPIPGSESKNVVSSWDILNGSVKGNGHCVVIGGGLVGAETAEFLANEGCKVTIVEMMDKIAKEESSTVLPYMMKDFAEHGVIQLVNTKVLGIENDGKCVKVLNTSTNEENQIACDMVVMAAGSVKNNFNVEGINVPLYYAGDCSGQRTAGIAEAIRSGYKAANEI